MLKTIHKFLKDVLHESLHHAGLLLQVLEGPISKPGWAKTCWFAYISFLKILWLQDTCVPRRIFNGISNQVSWVGEQLPAEWLVSQAPVCLSLCIWALAKDTAEKKWVFSYKMKQATLELSQFSRTAWLQLYASDHRNVKTVKWHFFQSWGLLGGGEKGGEVSFKCPIYQNSRKILNFE